VVTTCWFADSIDTHVICIWSTGCSIHNLFFERVIRTCPMNPAVQLTPLIRTNCNDGSTELINLLYTGQTEICWPNSSNLRRDCLISSHLVLLHSETSIYRSQIIRFPGSVVQFFWPLSESYFNYGSRIYCFPGSIVSFSDPRRKQWIEVSLYQVPRL
jgi:hypothetical protein